MPRCHRILAPVLVSMQLMLFQSFGDFASAPLSNALPRQDAMAANTVENASVLMSPAEITARRSANKLLEEGKFEEAVARAKEVSIKFNRPEVLFLYTGKVCLLRHDWQGAVDSYEKYMRIMPNPSTQAVINKALAFIGMEGFTSLWSDCDPGYREHELRLIKCKQRYWFYYVAEEHLKEHPDDQRVMVFLADYCLRNGGSDRYKELMTKIDPKVRDDKELLEIEDMVRSGKVKDAIPIITRMLHKRQCGRLYGLLAKCLAFRRRKDDAIKALAKARALTPESEYVYAAEALCLMLEQKYELALAAFDKYLACDLCDNAVLWKKLETLLFLGREKEAIEIIDKGGLAKAGTAACFAKLSDFYAGIFKPREALRCIDRAIAMEPKNADYYALRAAEEANIWLFQEGVDDCKRALALDPHQTEAKKLKSKCEQELAREKGPIEHGVRGLARMADIAGDRKMSHRENEK